MTNKSIPVTDTADSLTNEIQRRVAQYIGEEIGTAHPLIRAFSELEQGIRKALMATPAEAISKGAARLLRAMEVNAEGDGAKLTYRGDDVRRIQRACSELVAALLADEAGSA